MKKQLFYLCLCMLFAACGGNSDKNNEQLSGSLLDSKSASSVTTYYSIADGDWSDAAVWSTDGNASCSCTPPLNMLSDSVIVRNNINLTSNVTVFSGSSLNVTSSGQLEDGGDIYEVEVRGGTVIVDGILHTKKLVSWVGSNIEVTGILIVSNGNFNNNGNIIVHGGSVIVSVGNMVNSNAGTITLEPGTVWRMSSGNIQNDGMITLDNACIVCDGGNIKNEANGMITGTGGVSVAGTVNNSGAWANTVAWCAGGSGQGLPFPEDCGAANSCNALLPVTYDYFRGHKTGEDIQIEWRTTEEPNNSHFVVLRATSGTDFQEIGKVQSSPAKLYSFLDNSAPKGTNYYRLKQVDLNGTSTMSKVVAITKDASTHTEKLYPNPFRDRISLDFQGNQGDKMDLQVIDVAGKSILQKSYTYNGAMQTEQLDLSNNPAGTYIVSFTIGGEKTTKKIIKQ